MSIDYKADISVVGYHGRKGPKDDPTVMGSAVKYLSTGSKVPTMIIKDPKKRVDKPEGVFRFCACIDGSDKSMKALNLIC